LEEKATTKRQLNRQRRQKEKLANDQKFGKQKLGMHG